jgi:uncharacterized protein YfdQ (DUF2303 family)
MCDKANAPNDQIPIGELNNEGIFVVPDNFQTIDLLLKQNIHRFLSGTYHTNDIDSFVGYITSHIGDHGTVRVFVNGSDMKATTYIDLLLNGGKFGGKKHMATIGLRKDYKMDYISNLTNREQTQARFVDLLTLIPVDNIRFLDSDQKIVNYETAIGIFNDLTIEKVKSNRTKITDASYAEKKSLSETISGSDVLPSYIVLNFNMFEGIDNSDMCYKIKYITNHDKPMMHLMEINHDQIMEECAKKFCSIIRERFNGKAEVYIGDFSK